MDLFFFSLAVIVLIAIGQIAFVIVIARLAVHKLEIGQPEKQIQLMLISIFTSILTAVILAYTIGFGFLLSCLLIPSTIIAVTLGPAIATKPSTSKAAASYLRLETKRKVAPFYLLTCLILPASILFSSVGGLLIMDQCDAAHRRAGNVILPAIQKYQRDHGKLPEQLNELVSTYLPQAPQAACFIPLHWLGIEPDQIGPFQGYDFDYAIITCPENFKVIAIEDMWHDQPQVLNIHTGKWSYSIGDTLDESVNQRICRAGAME